MHMTGVDLKPCPFCGGAVTFHPYIPTYDDAFVYCETCAVEGQRFADSNHKAITAWNTRADLSQAAVEAVLEKLVEAVWKEYLDSERNRWTFRKEHVENAIVRTLAELTGGKDER